MKKRVKNSRIKKISIEISKRNIYTLGIILIFLIGVSAVVAIGSNDYNKQGHDLGELGLPNCGVGQALVRTSVAVGGWGCGSVSSGSVVGGYTLIQSKNSGITWTYRNVWGATCSGPWGGASCTCNSGNTVGTSEGYAWINAGDPDGYQHSFLCVMP